MNRVNKLGEFAKIYGLYPLKLTRRFFYLAEANKTLFSWRVSFSFKAIFAFNFLPRATAQKAILVVLHQNPFLAVGGVERETVTLLKRLASQHADHLLLVLFFDNARRAKFLTTISEGKITEVTKIPEATSIANIITTFRIKLSIVEHLINHSLTDLNILLDQNIPTMFFIHDFYYLFKIPYPSTLNMEVPEQLKNWWLEINNLLGQKQLFIIFNSEFTRNTYQSALELPALRQENVLVSYPVST